MQELIEKGEVKDYEIELMKKNGQISFFVMIVKLIFNEKENVLYFEGLVCSLDEWKQNQLLIWE